MPHSTDNLEKLPREEGEIAAGPTICAMIGAQTPEQPVMPSLPSPQGSRVISRVLPVAIKFWLQTQLDQLGDLSFEIHASDRQVLTGNLPEISLSAQQAVYKGVHITDVAMQAGDIQINIGQVLRGKPLRLKQAFPIAGQVVVSGDDLATSSTDSILAEGLLELWQTLLAQADIAAEIVTHYGPDALPNGQQLAQCRAQLHLVDNDVCLQLEAPQGGASIRLRGSLAVAEGHILWLPTAHWCLPSGEDIWSDALTQFRQDLGDQVEIHTLAIENDILICQCRLMVQT